MADTSEIIAAVGTAVGSVVVAGIAAWKGGRRSERRSHRTRSEPYPSQPHQVNGSVMNAAAEMLEGSTEALAIERKAREDALKQVIDLSNLCARQGAEIETLKSTVQHQAGIIKELTALVTALKSRIETLEKASGVS